MIHEYGFIHGHQFNHHSLIFPLPHPSLSNSFSGSVAPPAQKTTADIVGALKLDEAHDILAAMKHIVEEDGGARAKMILDAHPQLVPALIQIQCRLGMSVPPELMAGGPPPHMAATHGHEGGEGTQQHQQHLLQQVVHTTLYLSYDLMWHGCMWLQ